MYMPTYIYAYMQLYVHMGGNVLEPYLFYAVSVYMLATDR